jgi:hypothetical protein
MLCVLKGPKGVFFLHVRRKKEEEGRKGRKGGRRWKDDLRGRGQMHHL